MVLQRVKGFTLVELLVAISLLSMVIFIGAYSYSLYVTSWQKVNKKLDDNIYYARNLHLLRKAISSTSVYLYRENDDLHVLFEGNQSSLLGVSSQGVFANDEPVFYKLFVEESNEQSQLVYEELSVAESGYNLNSTKPWHRLIIEKEVEQFGLAFWGWQGLKFKYTEIDERAEKQWFESYSATEARLLPEALTLKWQNQNQEPILLFIELIDGSDKYISRAIADESDV